MVGRYVAGVLYSYTEVTLLTQFMGRLVKWSF